MNSKFDVPPSNPLLLFKAWLKQADSLNIVESRGFALSTISDIGIPSSRIVLLKDIDDEGVIFSTSELTKKGKDLSNNPLASGTLWWRETMQQINFSGRVKKLPAKFSDKIFAERTKEAQAIAALSEQSSVMIDEQELRKEVLYLLHEDRSISRPKTWHAYHITIESIEFWIGNLDRFHHRLRYDLENGVWQHYKLQP